MTRQQATDQEKIFSVDISPEGLVYKIYKELLKLNITTHKLT